MEGAAFIAKSLKDQGVEYIFGVVGIPVTPIAFEAQKLGIKYYGFRNEQSASYAASIVGYISPTNNPAVCLTVSGPGVIHALSGLMNAQVNKWPMILLSSGCETDRVGFGAFQEAPQMEAASVYTKFSARVERLERFPFFLEKALREATHGVPGPTFLEIPGDLVSQKIDTTNSRQVHLTRVPRPTPTLVAPSHISQAIDLLRNAKKPLLIIGTGALYSLARDAPIESFVAKSQIPFLTLPMAKGVISDDSPFCVGPARSLALMNADVVLVLGANFNWMLSPASFNKDVKLIVSDINPEEIHNNRRADTVLLGDPTTVVHQLFEQFEKSPFTVQSDGPWWTELREKIKTNQGLLDKQIQDSSVPMKYHFVYSRIRRHVGKSDVVVNEGANTMDIGRLMIPTHEPKCRLDAGVLGTMGVGMGYALASAIVNPTRKVIAIEGDSAFGFSGMELETICRYGLPICVIIINNNGIYEGVSELPRDAQPSPLSLLPNSRYEKIMEAFGGKGYFVQTPSELDVALEDALVKHKALPSLINIMISPQGPTPKNVAKKT